MTSRKNMARTDGGQAAMQPGRLPGRRPVVVSLLETRF
jgi:hypothetical protein